MIGNFVELPKWLRIAASALAVDDTRAEAGTLRSDPPHAHWDIAEVGLRARSARAEGEPQTVVDALLPECRAKFEDALGGAGVQLKERTPLSLAAALAMCDVLIATAVLLGREFDEGQALSRNLRAASLYYERRIDEAMAEIERAMALVPEISGEGDVWTNDPHQCRRPRLRIGQISGGEQFRGSGFAWCRTPFNPATAACG